MGGPRAAILTVLLVLLVPLLAGVAGQSGPQASSRPTGFSGGEPTLAVADSGALFIAAGAQTIRSLDNGVTWEVVHDRYWRGADQRPYTADDAVLFHDPVTDRIFVVYVIPGPDCAGIAWSDDDGASWQEPQVPCIVSGVNFQKAAAGPPGAGANPFTTGVGVESVAYLCYNTVRPASLPVPMWTARTKCSMSYDGGTTWPLEATVFDAARDGCAGGAGAPAIGPDGVVAIATAAGCPTVTLAVSTNSGGSWRTIPGPGELAGTGADPRVAFADDGSLHVLWRGNDHNLHLARTTDLGTTWQGPWPVAPAGIGSTWFSTLTPGSDGRLAMAYIGTADHEGPASEAPDAAAWHLFLSYTEDAANGTFAHEQVTPADDPVQYGPVCYSGMTGCARGRNLLDFIDSAVTRDGRFIVAFADGCVDGCASVTESGSDQVAVARLDGWALRPGPDRGGSVSPNEAAIAMPITEADAMASLAMLASFGLAGGLLGLLIWRFFTFLAGFTRLARHDLLTNDARQAILAHLKAEPGASFSDLKRLTGLANGALTHHVRMLENASLLQARRDGFRTRYYPGDARVVVAPYTTSTEARFMDAVRGRPDISQQDLAEAIGVSRDSVAYHARKLRARGLIDLVADGRHRRYRLRMGPNGTGRASPAADGGTTESDDVRNVSPETA